jgi:thiol-disulfide isomerase/thioredoxin
MRSLICVLGLAILAAEKPAATCKVTGTVAASEYARAGGTLERAIVWVFTDPGRERVTDTSSKERRFAFDLAPGEYRVRCTGVGSRGATFEATFKRFTVKPGVTTLDLGAIDMPSSAITRMYGKPAPEIAGVVGWKNTEPVTLKGLKGKVVVLDFWSYSCTICLHHKPDLARLAEKYRGRGLSVLTVHDSSADSIDKVEARVPARLKATATALPIALDGKRGVFQAFGVHAVPTVLLIDQDGNVVRRFHHAGVADLQTEVERLLSKKKWFSAKLADQDLRGEPKRSRTRRRKFRKLAMPKARHRMARRPWLKPSVLPLLDLHTK